MTRMNSRFITDQELEIIDRLQKYLTEAYLVPLDAETTKRLNAVRVSVDSICEWDRITKMHRENSQLVKDIK